MQKLTNLLTFLTLAILLKSCTPISNPTPTITGLIENNRDYCGGAAPPQDLLDQLATYQISSNQTFYVRQGNVNTPFTAVFKTFTTDINGKYNIQLPAGNYAVISQENYETESNPDIDSSCAYLITPDFTVTVTSAIQQTYNKKYTTTCNYVCLPYIPQ